MIATRDARPRLTAAEKDELLALWRDPDLTVFEIADRIGRSLVATRSLGQRLFGRRTAPVYPVLLDRVRAMRNARIPIPLIAQAVGLSPARVKRMITHYQLNPRSRAALYDLSRRACDLLRAGKSVLDVEKELRVGAVRIRAWRDAEGIRPHLRRYL